MNPWKISAQFAAYNWFLKENPFETEEAALQYAKRMWVNFLPCAHAGIGRLLIQLGERRRGARARRLVACV